VPDPCRILAALAVVCAWAPLYAARARQEAPPPPPPAEVVVPRVDRAPTLDDFLGMAPPPDLAGSLARVADRFVQRDPMDGAPPSQRTEVYLGYDEDHLYVVFLAFDDEPSRIRSNLTRRENIFGDDIVQIQLDTFHDRRRAYSFICNPLGIQFDSIWTEGQGHDRSFDTVWSSRGRLTDRGYVVWMAIPFKSLRFPPSGTQTWGLVFNRDIPRNNEEIYWPGVTRRISGRLNQAGVLRGLEEISPGRNLQFIPYATGRRFRLVDRGAEGGPAWVRDGLDPDLGIDVKTIVRDSFVVDLTVNPDFSQVESDDPQVTTNERFEVFFPEKRPFFLENSDYFQTPITLLFTRRIADPRLGARVTGKGGPWAVGALLIDDEAPGRIGPPGDPLDGERAFFGVARVGRDVGAQSHVAVMGTSREFGEEWNRVGSLDARLRLDDNWVTTLQAVTSSTRLQDGTRLSGPAWRADLQREGAHLDVHARFTDVAPGFRTQPGFVARTGVRQLEQQTSWTFRPEGRRLVAWRPLLYTLRTTDRHGLRLDEHAEANLRWEFLRQTSFEIGGSTGRERLRPEDFAALNAPADYSRGDLYVRASSRHSDRVGFESLLAKGHGINFHPPEGTRPDPVDLDRGEIQLTLRPASNLRVDTSWLFLEARGRAGGSHYFTNRIARTRWHWQLTRIFSLRAIVQYDTTRANPERTSLETDRRLNGDLLATWQLNPWTAVYAGYNGNWNRLALARDDTGAPVLRPSEDGLFQDARQVFFKVSWLFRI
jgi:hypothetical protein